MNPIANLKIVLLRCVYENGRQFETVKERKRHVREGRNKVGHDMRHKLLTIMVKRCITVLAAGGESRQY